jgi:signal transduction histidine kinase
MSAASNVEPPAHAESAIGRPVADPRFQRRLAHDITGNVGVVMNALTEATRDGDDEQKLRFRQMAERGLKRLERIAELVRLRVELSEPRPLEATPSDLGSLVREGLERARVLEARRGIDLVVADVPAIKLVADPRLLPVAIRELVSNAVAHARTRVDVRASVASDLVLIEVEDDGKGFATADVASSAAPERPRGLGVALGLVAEIAARHGGKLEICDASGGEARLSCVRISLPLTR